jgi:CBS domain-containing protein
VITDRDLALAVVADNVDPDTHAGEHASRPIVTGEVEMHIEEAVALMIQHRVRRLPVTDGDGLVGIVTIDDLAVRAGDLHQAQQITAEVAKAALPSSTSTSAEADRWRSSHRTSCACGSGSRA